MVYLLKVGVAHFTSALNFKCIKCTKEIKVIFDQYTTCLALMLSNRMSLNC